MVPYWSELEAVFSLLQPGDTLKALAMAWVLHLGDPMEISWRLLGALKLELLGLPLR
jgi:hypothetical protein